MAEITLTRNKITIIDDEDLELISRYKWYAHRNKSGNWYASSTINGVMTRMHSLLLGTRSLIDHKNGDGLDNRRENLRLATLSQNVANSKKRKGCTSQYKGVSWSKTENKWAAEIYINGTRIFIGLFSNEVLAAQSYDTYALAYFGEFARLNFPK